MNRSALESTPDPARHVVIVGGGFGGLYAAQKLKNANCRVTLVDRRNFHLFQPLLYQVATGVLSPANIAAPLRSVLRKQQNTQVLLAEVMGLDVAGRRLLLDKGELRYDTLVLAAGAGFNYFGRDDWAELAPGLKTIEDATTIRRRVLTAFEMAERETHASAVASWLTFVIVGGGPTGVEMAGSLAEIANHALARDFRTINPRDARIYLLEADTRILKTFPEKLSAKAANALGRIGVEVRAGVRVTDIQPDHVKLKAGDHEETITTRTVLWTAGVKASPLATMVGQQTGATIDRGGRVEVLPDLTLPGHPEIFVIGDMALCRGAEGQPLPGVAPVAMQQGRYVARAIMARSEGDTPPPFAYHDKGNMAQVGRGMAIVDLGWLRFSGFLAWVTWLFIHLLYLVHFQNRVLVLLQWAWNYITRSRAARLITNEEPAPPPKPSG